MSLYYGNTKIGSLYLGSDKIKEAYYGNVKVFGSSNPYNPYNLPPYTMRCAFSSGYTPEKEGATITLVDEANNVWDITRESWSELFYGDTFLVEVLGANASDVTDMDGTFSDCTNLVRVPAMDTSSVEFLGGTFGFCSNLQAIPDLPVDNVSYASNAFHSCTSVASGILSMYNKLSATGKVDSHNDTFRSCGSSTTTGAAELAQIPDDWK